MAYEIIHCEAEIRPHDLRRIYISTRTHAQFTPLSELSLTWTWFTYQTVHTTLLSHRPRVLCAHQPGSAALCRSRPLRRARRSRCARPAHARPCRPCPCTPTHARPCSEVSTPAKGNESSPPSLLSSFISLMGRSAGDAWGREAGGEGWQGEVVVVRVRVLHEARALPACLAECAARARPAWRDALTTCSPSWTTWRRWPCRGAALRVRGGMLESESTRATR